ncbi:hypothetical protein BH18VER1_BH18VER1_07160 [soil metagenome]
MVVRLRIGIAPVVDRPRRQTFALKPFGGFEFSTAQDSLSIAEELLSRSPAVCNVFKPSVVLGGRVAFPIGLPRRS